MRNYAPSLLATDAAERERFLAALRATGSMAKAALETGISETTARRQRNRDAAFDIGCAAVTGDSATIRLEAALIERAINGVARIKTWANGTVERSTDFNDELALTLLAKRMPDPYGEGAAATPPPAPRMTRDEFIAAIRARPRTADLERLGGEGAGLSAPAAG